MGVAFLGESEVKMSKSPSNSSKGVLSGWLRKLVKGRKGGDLPSGYEMIFQALGIHS